MRTMSNLSAGPLISKLRNSELALKRSSVSSTMSEALGSAVRIPFVSCEYHVLAYVVLLTDGCRTTNLRPNGQDGHIANLTYVRLIIERRMIRLDNCRQLYR
jgi:hypothetical protein